MQNRGEIDGLGMLAQDGADNFVFYKRLDAVERGFDSFFPFINLHALQPLPLRPDAREDPPSEVTRSKAHGRPSVGLGIDSHGPSTIHDNDLTRHQSRVEGQKDYRVRDVIG